MNFARYWPVNQRHEEQIHFTPEIISRHLVEDWLPAAPTLSTPLVGWAEPLTEVTQTQGLTYLGYSNGVRGMERQWKNCLSWLAGISGTRQVLQDEGYTWVAPLSAFYPEAGSRVDVQTAAYPFSPGLLSITSNPSTPSHQRPDYIAVSSTNWKMAVAESKGTAWALQNRHRCPSIWSHRVQNALVTYANQPVNPDRRIVVAVRSNPGAARSATRRFQVRAWNERSNSTPLPFPAATEIMRAALYGLCRKLSFQALL